MTVKHVMRNKGKRGVFSGGILQSGSVLEIYYIGSCIINIISALSVSQRIVE